MKKWLIQYFIVLSILLGGYFQLHARTQGEWVSSKSQTTFKVLNQSQSTRCEGVNHHNKDFVVTNSASLHYFVRTLFETTDSENEDDEKENSKLKKLSDKKLISINFDSYIATLFHLKSPETRSFSLFEKTAPVYSGFCSFSSDDRLYVIFENFRI